MEDAYPGSGTFPTSLWPVDQLLAGRQYVRVGSDAPAPMIARLDVALYYATSGERLAFSGADLPTIGRVKMVPHRWPKVRGNEPVARFGCGASLAVHERGEVTRPGEVLPVTLTWSVQSPPGRDYTVFVHLQDDALNIHGYGDGAPRGGNYPTWAWAANEVVVDEHALAVADETPPGRYRIAVGLYDAEGRVAVYGPDGERLPNDAVDLGTVEVR